MTAARTTPPVAVPGGRWRAALAVTAAVLLAHGWLLGRWLPAPGGATRAVAPVQVRRVVMPAAAAPAPTAVQAAPSSRPPAPRAAPTPAALPPAALALAGPLAEPVTEPAAPAAPPGAEPPPVYATRLPPPFARAYELRRGGTVGLATLQWAPDEAGYTLSLSGEGAAAARRRSEGGFDHAGLAPARYSESRRGRELRAANFRREAGLISYSGPSIEHPLLAGAQDRLSWMVQLAAVLAANPALAEPGAELKMLVAGTRGDAEVWRFAVAGPEAVELADGSRVAALRLEREPASPWDWRVQAWLDPADHHLPLRLRLLLRASGEGSEFLLRP